MREPVKDKGRLQHILQAIENVEQYTAGINKECLRQEQTATLKILYDSLSIAGTRDFEVYAVGYESDVDKWKNYVKEHQLPFVNVGGPNVNIDYQEAYNVHGAPTMIILNEERRIIMNKTLPTSSILPFLRDYEQKRSIGHR